MFYELCLTIVRRMRIVVFVVALFCSATCFAGAEQTFECRHCGLKGKYVQGDLMFARQIVAFCSNKDHIVNISWDYKKRGPKPAKFDSGVPVYVCPTCNTPPRESGMKSNARGAAARTSGFGAQD